MPRKTAKTVRPNRARRRVAGRSKPYFDRRVEHFSEEVGRLGEGFGRRMEKRGEEWDSWFHRTFGIIGPVISSLFGLLVFGLLIWAFGFIGGVTGIGAFSDIGAFLLNYMGMFFLIFLFFSFTSYFSRASPGGYRPISPFAAAVGVAIALWVLSQTLVIANLSLAVPALSAAAFYLVRAIPWIFLLALAIGYIVLAVRATAEHPLEREASMKARARRPALGGGPQAGMKRLYRSGRDKIIGGVCGGIAEYLGVDSVLVRLLWVIGTLAWGTGILLYIIAWIIMPKNPRHKW